MSSVTLVPTVDLINCFKNRVAEIRRKEAFSKLFKKFLEELGSWVHTSKVYTIFHVALQDQTTARPIALELKERENHLYPYSKNPGSRDYIETRHYELSKAYSLYIKKMVAFILEFKLIDQAPKKQLEMIKTTSPEDIICIYNNTKELISIITTKLYANTLFCCKYRIYRNILKLLYIDIVRLYRICYFCVSENLNNIKKLDVEQAKALHSMCQSFIEVTGETQKQVGGMASQLKESLPVVINYFKVAAKLKM
eukprot:TRINITY_DN1005_c0_g1_i21.p1 TRINITY_DN1005_c0_g1~~TRINITY_DN1005_c0_g1_i21.p1  ORF type:complete len:253 (-),score=65.26 TRINITY_DN1005_c0_g1_i21:611-1369(-)